MAYVPKEIIERLLSERHDMMVEDACEQWQKEHTEKFKPVLAELLLLTEHNIGYWIDPQYNDDLEDELVVMPDQHKHLDYAHAIGGRGRPFRYASHECYYMKGVHWDVYDRYDCKHGAEDRVKCAQCAQRLLSSERNKQPLKSQRQWLCSWSGATPGRTCSLYRYHHSQTKE
jgi:hypothetical protein